MEFLPRAPDTYDASDQDLLRAYIERRLSTLEGAANASSEKYVITDPVTIARDTTAVVDLADLIDVVETLIRDLRNKGVLS